MLTKRPLSMALFAGFAFALTLGAGLLNGEQLSAAFLKGPEDVHTGLALEVVTTGVKEGEWTYCDYENPALAEYNVELQGVTVSENIAPGTPFAVNMEFKNTGNTRLFSVNSGCSGDLASLSLGTQKAQDRSSLFGGEVFSVSGWSADNRIAMVQDYVDPGENFTVSFESIAPEGDNLYREFFQPVVEGHSWVGEIFSVDIHVGTVSDQMLADASFIQDQSMSTSSISGLERNLLIDLSDQKMYARFGDTTVWTVTISSGAWDTPTPLGSFEILTKQELRIGMKAPHYRMPYFQLWDWRGYGIHALPYLANDGGTFWTEALSHIGIPVSHGCIRTLPEDAVKLYEFTDIGTTVSIQR